MKKLELIPIVRKHGLSDTNLRDEILKYLIQSENNNSDEDSLKTEVKVFISKLKSKLEKNQRNYTRLMENESLSSESVYYYLLLFLFSHEYSS